MKKENFIYKKALREIGVTYLGSCLSNPKTTKSYKHGTLTYIIYLAPYNMSGYNVCPNAKYCKDLCLNGSGHNRADILVNGFKHSVINMSRIKKTKAFFEKRETFMKILIHEINRYNNVAKQLGINFAVRLNGTSDISPKAFHHKNVCGDKNILEIFPNIQFYDYTKVFSRTLLNDSENYDLTFSYNGYNWAQCEYNLDNNGRVAVVFEDKLPKFYKGYKVIDANQSDIRFADETGVICGLMYHRVANNYKNGKYEQTDNKFVVQSNNKFCIY